MAYEGSEDSPAASSKQLRSSICIAHMRDDQIDSQLCTTVKHSAKKEPVVSQNCVGAAGCIASIMGSFSFLEML
jgi:hypothetical protein